MCKGLRRAPVGQFDEGAGRGGALWTHRPDVHRLPAPDHTVEVRWAQNRDG